MTLVTSPPPSPLEQFNCDECGVETTQGGLCQSCQHWFCELHFQRRLAPLRIIGATDEEVLVERPVFCSDCYEEGMIA